MRKDPQRFQCSNFQDDSIQWLSSRHIWLSLDDSEQDSRKHTPSFCQTLLKTSQEQRLSAGDIHHYTNQLFYWLLQRWGNCPDPTAARHPCQRIAPSKRFFAFTVHNPNNYHPN